MLSREERQARLAAVGPSDEVTGSSLIGIVEAVKGLAPAAPAAQALVASEAEKRRVNDLRYPLTEFLRVAFAAEDAVAPHLPKGADPLEAIGLGIARFWINQPAAQIALKLIQGKNPVELMATVPAVVRSRYTFGERTYEKNSATRCTIHIRNDPMPIGIYMGLLGNTARLNGHTVQVRGETVDLRNSRLVVEWDGK